MRRAARVDANQAQIVAVYRAVGATVESLSRLGDDVPDLLVGYRGQNFVIEVKNPQQDPNKRKLRPGQVRWHAEWRGQKAVVETVEQALAVIGVRP